MAVALRRLKIYDRRRVGHPVGELAKGQRVEVKRIYPPDDCERFWAEMDGERFIVIDAPRGRRVKLLIGVEYAE